MSNSGVAAVAAAAASRSSSSHELSEPPAKRARTSAPLNAWHSERGHANGLLESVAETDAAAAAAAPAMSGSDSAGAESSTRAASSGSSLAAQAAGASSAPAALRRPRPLSAAARCDADSLSIVFSFLNTPDFLAAIRVSRQWRTARLKPTAWPKFSLPTFVQALRDDNYDDSTTRRLSLSLTPGNLKKVLARLRGHADAVPSPAGSHSGAPVPAHATTFHATSAAPLTAALAFPALFHSPPSLWRYASDATLELGIRMRPASADEALRLVSQLLHLSVLNCRTLKPTAEAVQSAFSAMADRLQALLLFECAASFFVHLPMLAQLRVLVLDQPPHVESILPLHQLQYLHFSDASSYSPLCFQLGHVLRWLSSAHALRSLSVQSLEGDGVDSLLRPPLANASDGLTFSQLGHGFIHDQAAAREMTATAHLPPVDRIRPCGLTDVSVERGMDSFTLALVLQLPGLARFQTVRRLVGSAFVFGHLLALPPPQQLRLNLSTSHRASLVPQIRLDHVAQVTHLRVLQLSFTATTKVHVRELLAALVGSASSLEEVRFHHSIQLKNPEGAGFMFPVHVHFSADISAIAPPNVWSPLARCLRLRVLELAVPANSGVLDGLPEVLGTLPSIHSLELMCPHSSFLHGVSCLMPHVARSGTWSSLHLHVTSLASKRAVLHQLLPPEGMPHAVVRRVRAYVHGQRKQHAYVIRATTEGQLGWQKE